MKKILFFAAVLLLVSTSCSKETDLMVPEDSSTNVQSNQLKAGTWLREQYNDGWNGGMFWTVWKIGGSGSINFPAGGGNFDLRYQNVKNVVGGKGWNPGNGKTVGYNVGSVWGDYDFIGVYGWARNNGNLIEYYAMDMGPGGIENGAKNKGEVTCDGKKFTFWEITRNDYNVDGYGPFTQYKNVRKYPQAALKTNNKINMGEHAYNWNKKGKVGFGGWCNYQVFGIEVYSNSYNASGGINATVWQE
jgi:endo-1,4-beta-xylanase